jgi:hypothetical protein
VRLLLLHARWEKKKTALAALPFFLLCAISRPNA